MGTVQTIERHFMSISGMLLYSESSWYRFMTSHSKSKNFIAILIALLLFAAGFIMLFIHQQSESDEQRKTAKEQTTAIDTADRSGYPSLG